MKVSTILVFLFGIVVFIISRQFPFSSFSLFANISLVVIFGIVLVKKKINYQCLSFLLWGGSLLGYSLIQGNQPGYIFRFTLIFILILCAYYIKLNKKIFSILFFFIGLQCVVIIVIEFYLLIFFDSASYLPVRTFFTERQWGDVYTYSGNFYFIQLKGNALIPFTYMLCYAYPFSKDFNRKLNKILLLTGIIVCGNFTYYIVIILFHIFLYFRNSHFTYRSLMIRIIPFLILFVMLSPFLLSYTSKVLERKNDSSLGARYEQAEVLWEDMNENALTLIAGKGLGNIVTKQTATRDYSDHIYYELQTLYFFNQLGFINFLLFAIVNLHLAYKFITHSFLLIIYLFYLIYAFTNPYILDTNQIIVIISLVTLKKIYDENRLHTSIV